MLEKKNNVEELVDARECWDDPAYKIPAERSSKPLCRVNFGQISELSVQMLVLADFRTGFPTFSRFMDVVPSLLVLPSCLRSRTRRVQLVRCFPSRCTLLVHQHVPMCPSVRR